MIAGPVLPGITIGLAATLSHFQVLDPFTLGLSVSASELVGCGIAFGNLSRKKYQDYHFFNERLSCVDVPLTTILSKGALISVQRFTEWGRQKVYLWFLLLISRDSVLAMGPSLEVLTIVVGTFHTSVAQGAALMMTDSATACKAHKNSPTIVDKAIVQANTIIRNMSIASLGISAVAALFIILARDWISRLFIPSTETQAITLSNTLLLITAAGIFPDGLRILNIALMRPWGLFVLQTIVNFVAMILVASEAGYGASFLGRDYFSNTTNHTAYLNHTGFDWSTLTSRTAIVGYANALVPIPLAATLYYQLRTKLKKTQHEASATHIDDTGELHEAVHAHETTL